ncbi:MAG: Ig-like domain-containing protein [Clostridiales bacterium]|jgi:hypothetical protein|nr:Ig-like domain-containing protein [Eubacteriales bacterium]MDH7566228.1 Ig-like domain-containing protein [Clostridiales bacterium]
MRKNQKRLYPLLAGLLAALLLAAQLPVPALAAEAGGAAALDWNRDTFENDRGVSPANTRIRDDECPSVDGGGNAYIAQEDGYLYCIAPDGIMRWKVDLNQPGAYSETGGKRPVFDREGNSYIGSGDGYLYSISPEGQVRWTFKMEGAVAPGTSPALSPDGQTVYVATRNLYLHAVDTSGKALWKVRLNGAYSCSTPAVAPDGTIYVGSSSIVNAVDPSSKSLKWYKQLPENRYIYMYTSSAYPYTTRESRMAVGQDGTLYVSVGKTVNGSRGFYDNLLAMGPDGQVKWIKDENRSWYDPAVFGDRLYCVTSDQVLHVLDAATGEETESVAPEEEVLLNVLNRRLPGIPMVDSDGTVLVTMGDSIYALSPDGSFVKKSGDTGYFLSGVSCYGPSGELYSVGHKLAGSVDTAVKATLLKFTDTSYAPEASVLRLEDGQAAMLPGGSFTPSLDITDADGRRVYRADLEWKSDNPEVASVSEVGLVTARKAGSASITVSSRENPGVADSLSVSVLPGTTGLSLTVSAPSTKLLTGSTLSVKAEITAIDGLPLRGEALEWGSTLPAVAAVDGNGTVTGVKEGSAEIKVRLQRFPDISGKLVLTVGLPEVKKLSVDEINQAIDRTLSWFRKQGVPGDWAAFALNAIGEDINKEPYVDNGETYIDRLKKNAANLGTLMTDYERTAIAVVSAGYDPETVLADRAIDLMENILNYSGMGQGINAAVFGLIGVDAANAEIPAGSRHTREEFIQYILDNRTADGNGWAYGGGTPDPDMTAMALYALAPYRERADVKAAGEKAIAWLSKNQQEDGRFGSWGTINSESCSQVIMGITAWGIDPQGPQFTKSRGNAVTGWLSFQTSSGVFMHMTTEDPGMASDQALEAMAALKQFYSKGVSTIFYKIKYAGAGSTEDITSLEVYPGDLVLEAGQSFGLRAKDQKGFFVPDDKVAWKVSNPATASVIIDEESKAARLKALEPGEVVVTASLKDKAEIFGQGRVAVAGKDFDIAKADSGAGGQGKDLGVSATNTSGAQKSAVFIVIVYSRDTGKVVHISYVDRDFLPGEAGKVNGFYRIPEADRDKYGIKVLVWDQLERPRPLSEAILEKQQSSGDSGSSGRAAAPDGAQ